MSLGPTSTVPLTTIFTPPANCKQHWTYEPSATDGNDIPGGLLLQRAQGPPVASVSVLDRTCYPPLGDSWGRYPGTTYIFSPGVCPHGYTTALQSNGPTTTGTCCPSNFGYTSMLGTLNGGTANVVFYGCTSLYNAADGPTSVFAITPYGTSGTLDNTAGLVTTINSPIIMWAQPITVATQERDSVYFPMSTSTSSTSSTVSLVATTQADVKVTASSQASSPAPNPSPSLSNGAIAGIAVGAAAVLLLFIAGFFLLRRKRANKKQEIKSSPAFTTPSTFMSPASFETKFEPYRDSQPVELETTQMTRHELESREIYRDQLEMPGRAARSNPGSPWLRSD